MITMPYETIIAKIKEKSGLTDAEIDEKIKAKLTHLSGLISREGAAHIIANELAVKLFEQTSGKLKIKNVLSGMRSVEMLGVVRSIYEKREFVQGDGMGKVRSMLIGDETGLIRIVCWGSKVDNLSEIKEGDIVKVVGAYARDNQGRVEVHVNDRAKLIINPPGENVTLSSTSSEQPIQRSFTRKKISELKEQANDIELMGTVVQVADLRFFEVCPKCGKKARQRDDKYACDTHGEVVPDYSFFTNVSLDDGTGSVRIVFFRDQAEKLLNKQRLDMLAYRTNPEGFNEGKNSLLGKIIKVDGRAVNNTMFNRIEFIAQKVDTNPNPEEEIKSLDTEIEELRELDSN